ncbi:MAG: EamA family transporter [Chloroflexi bacterium]|nr:EamA family transporter [Chloroflexota bacterium]
MHPHPRTGYALSVLAAIVWAATAPGLAYLITTYRIPGLTLALWRDVFIAGACIAGVLLVRPAMLRIGRREIGNLALTGIVSIGVYHALWLWSVTLNGAAVAVVLIYTYPTFVTIGAWLLFREPIGKPHMVALALALAGCALVVRAYDPAVLRISWPGAAIGLLTALTHTVYVLVGQRNALSISPWATLTYTMTFGSLTLLVLVVGADMLAPAQRSYLWAVDEPLAWLILAAIAIGPTLSGYALFTLALRHIPGRVAGLISVIEAPVATMIAVALLGERLESLQVLGMAMILSAIALPRLVVSKRQVAPVAAIGD